MLACFNEPIRLINTTAKFVRIDTLPGDNGRASRSRNSALLIQRINKCQRFKKSFLACSISLIVKTFSRRSFVLTRSFNLAARRKGVSDFGFLIGPGMKMLSSTPNPVGAASSIITILRTGLHVASGTELPNRNVRFHGEFWSTTGPSPALAALTEN